MIDFLNNLSGAELVLLSSIISIYISQGLTADEVNLLGNFFSSIGENLSTIAGTLPENGDDLDNIHNKNSE